MIVFWAGSEADKGGAGPGPGNSHLHQLQFDGHPSVLARSADPGRLTLDDLREVVQDAWLARASSTPARGGSTTGHPSQQVRIRRRLHSMRDDARMILEHALLDVTPGAGDDFQRAFAEARHIIAGAPGFRRLSLSRGIEKPDRYLLLVEWDRLEDHTEGFRASPAYDEWRHLLHRFYDPFPTVEHYETCSALP